MSRRTTLSIDGDRFRINGRPTYPGRMWTGHRIEGLLLNARLVQGIFDDLNPRTRSRWDYPDGPWDARRNTDAFIAAMPSWREHGLLAFDLSLQGGSPEGYSKRQPWHNSAFDASGSLRPDYLGRLERILDRADELGMAVILCLFYFGQDQHLTDEAAVIGAVDRTVDWLGQRGYRNLIIEIANECDVPQYDQAILRPDRVHELIERVQQRSDRRWHASVSFMGNSIPTDNVLAVADVVLMHGNGVGDPARIRQMVRIVRDERGFAGPILFNEDDHYEFDQADNNFVAAISQGASWGYFDFRRPGEPFEAGYQSLPTDWEVRHARKRGFFDLLREITGS